MDKKILLIEDDDFIREMYTTELTKNNFQIFACNNGEKGLALLKDNQFDLVLLDIMLPGVNGLEVLKQIRQNPKTEALKVVLLTNLGQEAVIKQGFECGAIGYLIKSAYNPDQIINEVKKFLGIENLPASQ